MNLDFYRKIYKEVYAREKDYGNAHHKELVPEIVDFLRSTFPDLHKPFRGDKNLPSTYWSIMDFGCGTGSFLKAVRNASPEATLLGIDVVRSLTMSEEDILFDGTFGPADRAAVITSFDTLEHLFEEDIKEALDDFRQILLPKGRMWIRVCSVPAIRKPPYWLTNLHLTIKPFHWWVDLFSEHFKIIRTVEPLIVAEHK